MLTMSTMSVSGILSWHNNRVSLAELYNVDTLNSNVYLMKFTEDTIQFSLNIFNCKDHWNPGQFLDVTQLQESF